EQTRYGFRRLQRRVRHHVVPGQHHHGAALRSFVAGAGGVRRIGTTGRSGDVPAAARSAGAGRGGGRHRLMNWLAWSLLSAVFAALTAILAKIGVAGVDANLATAVRTSVVVIFTWLLALSTTSAGRFQHFSGKTWAFLALSGVATGLSWLCYF